MKRAFPPPPRGRLSVAEKILLRAADYGIAKKDLLFDPLTMAISADPSAATVTLKALSLIKNTLGANTILGVSNVSFGLPQRENINATFFALALKSGLSAAIMNPGSLPMQNAYHSFNALFGKDPQCAAYIARYADKAEPTQAKGAFSLFDAIVGGLKTEASAAASRMVRTSPPLNIIRSELVPALNRVGKGFEEGTLFLPQLLMSAEAAKAAFETLRSHMGGEEQKAEKKEKIVLATVQGDIHDIGKNIVKVLLENYGYDVIDLGKDVPPEEIVAAVLRHNVRLAGLSALMTTTVTNMEQTIIRLRARGARLQGDGGRRRPYRRICFADRGGLLWQGRNGRRAICGKGFSAPLNPEAKTPLSRLSKLFLKSPKGIHNKFTWPV